MEIRILILPISAPMLRVGASEIDVPQELAQLIKEGWEIKSTAGVSIGEISTAMIAVFLQHAR